MNPVHVCQSQFLKIFLILSSPICLGLSTNHQISITAQQILLKQEVVHFAVRNASVIASKEISLEVNAEKTRYVVMSWDQNIGHNRSIKRGNTPFKTVEHFKYLGTTLTNQNPIHAEIKSRLKSGNACYHSVQNLLSCESSPLPHISYGYCRESLFLLYLLSPILEQLFYFRSDRFKSLSRAGFEPGTKQMKPLRI
jgi:hypothetical protein